MADLQLDSHKTVLVLIDLQNAIVSMSTAPHPAVQGRGQFGKAGGSVSRPRRPSCLYPCRPQRYPRASCRPAGQPGEPHRCPPLLRDCSLLPDFSLATSLLTKRHWGAFAGTNLEQQLRSHGVDTVVLTGISTNAGVESTARQGTGLGFGFVVVEDACSGQDGEQHRFAFEKIFPRPQSRALDQGGPRRPCLDTKNQLDRLDRLDPLVWKITSLSLCLGPSWDRSMQQW